MRVGWEKIILAATGLVLVLACLWVYLGVRFDLWTPAGYARYRWLCYQIKIAPEFWHGKIKAGDDARPIVRTWPPQIIHQFGPWAELEWVPLHPDKNHSVHEIEIEAIAKNARFVSARFYADDGIGERTFFNALTPAAEAQYQTYLKAYTWGELSRKPIPSNPARKPHPHK
jgi:hypothetical protein